MFKKPVSGLFPVQNIPQHVRICRFHTSDPFWSISKANCPEAILLLIIQVIYPVLIPGSSLLYVKCLAGTMVDAFMVGCIFIKISKPQEGLYLKESRKIIKCQKPGGPYQERSDDLFSKTSITWDKFVCLRVQESFPVLVNFLPSAWSCSVHEVTSEPFVSLNTVYFV